MHTRLFAVFFASATFSAQALAAPLNEPMTFASSNGVLDLLQQ